LGRGKGKGWKRDRRVKDGREEKKKRDGMRRKTGNGRGVAPASAPRSASDRLQFSARNDTKLAFIFGIPCETPEIKERVCLDYSPFLRFWYFFWTFLAKDSLTLLTVFGFYTLCL